MHSSKELSSSSFEIEVGGRPSRIEELFEGFEEQDRLGVVLSEPCGALGASALITATITAFYDIQRARSDDFFIYPDYFLFHVGEKLGDHRKLDVWPAHKEVVVDPDPQRILEAIDDRAITRLVVEDGEPGRAELDEEEVASARARVLSCLAYSPSGRVGGADVRIRSNPVTERYVTTTLGREPRAELAREELMEDGVPVETYRRIGLDEALALLG